MALTIREVPPGVHISPLPDGYEPVREPLAVFLRVEVDAGEVVGGARLAGPQFPVGAIHPDRILPADAKSLDAAPDLPRTHDGGVLLADVDAVGLEGDGENVEPFVPRDFVAAREGGESHLLHDGADDPRRRFLREGAGELVGVIALPHVADAAEAARSVAHLGSRSNRSRSSAIALSIASDM